VPQQQATINFAVGSLKFRFTWMQLKPENSKWERGVFPTINFFFSNLHSGENSLKIQLKLKTRDACSLSPVPHKFHGNQPALQVIQTSFKLIFGYCWFLLNSSKVLKVQSQLQLTVLFHAPFAIVWFNGFNVFKCLTSKFMSSSPPLSVFLYNFPSEPN